MATRKISDLTLLGAGEVSSSDTLLLLDNSDPTDQNKRSAVGSIFTAVPSGTYTLPGVRFEGKTSTGVFSETQGQVGLAMGNARLNLQKVGTTLNIQAKDDADQNLDFTISAQGTGKIRLGSVLAISDLNFIIPNSIDETKIARFSTANLTAGLTNVYTFPSNEGLTNTTDQLVTLKATQTLENKTLVSASFSGTLSIESFTSSGNATIGSDAADSLTVNAGSTFASAVTFANTVVAQQGVTSNGAISAPSLSLTDDGTTGGGNTILKIRTDDGSPWALVIGNDTYASSPSTGTGFYVSNTGDHNVWFRNNQEFKSVFFKQDDTQGNEKTAIEFTPTHEVKLYHNAAERLSTTATGITIGGAIDAVTSTGSTIIAGNGSAGKFIIQKGVGGIGLHFTDNTGTDQMVLNSAGNLGIGKNPNYRLDVSGNSWIDGDVTINSTNPAAGVGGTVYARQVVLTNQQTGASATLDASTAGGVSRGRVFFHKS